MANRKVSRKPTKTTARPFYPNVECEINFPHISLCAHKIIPCYYFIFYFICPSLSLRALKKTLTLFSCRYFAREMGRISGSWYKNSVTSSSFFSVPAKSALNRPVEGCRWFNEVHSTALSLSRGQFVCYANKSNTKNICICLPSRKNNLFALDCLSYLFLFTTFN